MLATEVLLILQKVLTQIYTEKVLVAKEIDTNCNFKQNLFSALYKQTLFSQKAFQNCKNTNFIKRKTS
jgi:hypothetical protein